MIVAANSDDVTLCTRGPAIDFIVQPKIHVLPVVAWSIEKDGEIVLPITPAGRANPGGAWFLCCGERCVTSDGNLVANRQAAEMWLEGMAAQ